MTTEPRQQTQHTEAQYQAIRLRLRQLIRLFREQGYAYDEIEVCLLQALESEMETEV